MSTRLSFVTVDVFTSVRFGGNPLAIVDVPKRISLSQEQKQIVAREFNFSETVFLHETDGLYEGRKLDIFTTTAELPFAGHPTIGTLCYIGSQSEASSSAKVQHAQDHTQDLQLLTKAGTIVARYHHPGRTADAEIPHNFQVHDEFMTPASILEMQPRLADMAKSRSITSPLASIVKGMTFILIELPNDSEHLGSLSINQPPLPPDSYSLNKGWEQSFVAPYYYVITNPESKSGVVNIRARMIESSIGEDPATGSAACTLACRLAQLNRNRGLTHDFAIEQGVEMGRPSQIRVRVTLRDDGRQIERVVLSGSAVLVTQGTINI
ncbi:hypothetical protein MMC19_001338 [Ptychographa xylographoides]|nr:hypothetical protein [Ptychographa xylographoides]